MRGDPMSFDTYVSAGIRTRLWDGTMLDTIKTPRHDLGTRARPFPQQRNFFYTRAVEESARWFRAAADPAPEVFDRLIREDVAGFVSWTYPDATAAQLRALSDFHNWSVWLDDLMDRRSTLDTSLGACSVLESLGERETAPFDDFFGRMRRLGMTDACADRFVAAMRLYGSSSRVEVDVREGARAFASVADYVGNRRRSAAMPVYQALITWISRVDLPDEIYRHPLVRHLESCCSDYCSLYNDAGSFVKEHLAGRGEGTFVRLLSATTELPVQDTLYEIIDMAAAAAEDLSATSDRIDECDLPAPHREQIHFYAEGLRKFVGGVNIWSNSTARYVVGQDFVDIPAASRAGDRYGLRQDVW
ncbi:terpene synthase family protein [Nocardia brasiliensis]|uniref:terpene synthase family protein n=1 Tax=Nocardia brasiliensis TaxID=37326 RepID=UPI002455AB86|nr:hypothetical protein [Nocardia brasiliensis]